MGVDLCLVEDFKLWVLLGDDGHLNLGWLEVG